METVYINYFAVGLAAAIGLIVSSLWYSKGLSIDRWAALTESAAEGPKDSSWLSLIVSLLCTAGLSWAMAWLSWVVFVGRMSDHGLSPSYFSSALLVGLGLTAITGSRLMIHTYYSGKPWRLGLLSAGHDGVVFLSMSVVLGLLGAS